MSRELRSLRKSAFSLTSPSSSKVAKTKRVPKIKRKEAPHALQTPQPKDERTIFFYGQKNDYGFFSQHYLCNFTDPVTKTTYTSTEQYMMHGKGLLFAPNSQNTADMLIVDDPRKLKAMGRQTENFDQAVWEEKRFGIVMQGNLLKFRQNPELRECLMETGDKELVEAAPRDRIWGIGYGKERAPTVREKWGKNLLGKVLMEVRETLRDEEEETKRREELKDSGTAE